MTRAFCQILSVALLLMLSGGITSANTHRTELSTAMGKAMGRLHANVGILSAVVPNCLNQEVFFSTYGIILLEEVSNMLGTIRGIHFITVERNLGKEFANMSDNMARMVMASSYDAVKARFDELTPAQIPTACRNFKEQIFSGEWDFKPWARRYIEAFKLYEPDEYEKALVIIEMMNTVDKVISMAKKKTLLHKEDATAIFLLSKQEWNENVLRAHKQIAIWGSNFVSR